MPRNTPPVSASRHLLLCWHLGSVLATALSPLVLALLHAQAAVGQLQGERPGSTRSFAGLLEDVRKAADACEPPKCLFWTRQSPADMCDRHPWKRMEHMRKVLLFRDAPEPTNVFLSQLFLLDIINWRTESDLNVAANFAHLRNDSGRDCFGRDTERCVRCFTMVDDLLATVHHNYLKFNRTLTRFDCLVEETDRRFSPNATCENCKAWYRRWLLVNLGKHYAYEPCNTWCDYAQLACPHLTATKAGDYAGHPSFQCTDTDFPPPVGKAATPECECTHPCDLQATLGKGTDYFATRLHCRQRRLTCATARTQSPPDADRSSANARARCWGGWSLSRLVLLLVVWWTAGGP